MLQDKYDDLFENGDYNYDEYETENPKNVPNSGPTEVTKILFSAFLPLNSLKLYIYVSG